MAKIPYFDTYRQTKGLISRPIQRLAAFRTVAGTIERVDVWNPLDTEGTIVFNLYKNGVAVWSGSNRPTIVSPATHVSKTGLAIAVAMGDELSWNIDSVSGVSDASRVSPAFQVIVDDGGSGGGGGGIVTIGAGDGIAVDSTDPANPVVENTGVISLTAGSGVTIDDTDPQHPIISASGGGGGSVGLFSPDKPYSSPNALDDEFNAGSLDPKWTVIPSSTAPVLDWSVPNLVGNNFASGGNVLRGYSQAASGPMTLRAKVHATANGGVPMIFMGETGGGSPRYTAIGFNGQSLVGYEFLTPASVYLQYANATVRSSTFSGFVYLEMVYNGTTIVYNYSNDGLTFENVGTRTTAFPFGGVLDRIGFAFYPAGSLTRLGYIDWIRVLQGTFTGGNI